MRFHATFGLLAGLLLIVAGCARGEPNEPIRIEDWVAEYIAPFFLWGKDGGITLFGAPLGFLLLGVIILWFVLVVVFDR